MDERTRALIEAAKDQLRAAILFGNLKPARLALEALDEIGALQDQAPAAYDVAQGKSCEFCPDGGGGCIVCGRRN
jgi:hypothetical protein